MKITTKKIALYTFLLAFGAYLISSDLTQPDREFFWQYYKTLLGTGCMFGGAFIFLDTKNNKTTNRTQVMVTQVFASLSLFLAVISVISFFIITLKYI